MESLEKDASHWRQKLHEIVFESNTFWGKTFDVSLIGAILLSILVVFLDSDAQIHQQYGTWLYVAEWVFTILFSIEYLVRIISIQRPLYYVFSFIGIVDLLAIVPAYISLFVAGTQYLLVIRALRLLRIFRILKMWHFISEGQIITKALTRSYVKITVFIIFILVLVTILGSIMYLLEGGKNGFDNIPNSIYWAIVTLTTVGYGDISPATPLGKFFAAIIMLCGYGIIAVPTGIVTSELINTVQKGTSSESCPNCSREGHDRDATFCKYCGSKL
ncbi:ion transporter [Tellurirhabdus bombi]|uniref:ion transporter n=1 Tax=Tellurirhabdus bombi TaxID=2907205 RepID=UPI001F45EF86|nr:ion transporter [Tellurirhabdus bombi]